VIASTPYAAWDADRRREIAGAGWDMVVIDEATSRASDVPEPREVHDDERLPPCGAVGRSRSSQRAQSMLMLTATPMQLHRFELYSLIELLDPALFPTFGDFERHTGELLGLNATVRARQALERAHPGRACDSGRTILNGG